jgi:hypothetical protein
MVVLVMLIMLIMLIMLALTLLCMPMIVTHADHVRAVLMHAQPVRSRRGRLMRGVA